MRNSAVTTFKLSSEEINDYLEGKCSFEEITANKEPVKPSEDYSEEIDSKTYHLMKHKGMFDSEIAKHYGMKTGELFSIKARWGLKEHNYQIVSKGE